MATGKQRDEWDRCSLIAALINNDPQGLNKRVRPSRFHPFASPAERGLTTTQISDPKELARINESKMG